MSKPRLSIDLTMKNTSLVAIAISAASASAFLSASTTQNRKNAIVGKTTVRPMGLFDFFNEDARKEREERKQREIEEQERLQQEILARRSNPKMMEEYEAKVRVRRALRMSGNDEAAETVEMYGSDEEKIVGRN
ncbi:hypothetical protein ACHAW5_009103 [Stephanodiscus triporus]|uniref:Uncharacterized protein n=1 Tax=Stephanodiscus triporus TaxID=2934178 RepID=A0ABD3P6M2_9STRA